MSRTSDDADVPLSGFRDMCCTVLGTLFLIFASAGLAAAQSYTFTDLGAFEPRAIAGPYIVGQENGVPVRLNLDTGQKLTLGHVGQGGVAESVIPTGEAVGTVKVLNAQGQPENAAVFWDAAGTAFLMPGLRPSTAVDLNDAGTAAANGPCPLPNGQIQPQAMRWWPREGRTECLVGPFTSGGVAIAIDGQDAVWGRFANVVTVWEVGQPGYPQTGPTEGGVQGILSDADEAIAVGSSENFLASGTAVFGRLAAHFRAHTPATLLPAPAPIDHNTNCGASGINTARATVGSCSRVSDPQVPPRAFLWPDTTTFVDLNTQVRAPYALEFAVGINDEGEIVGVSGFTGTGWGNHWLLTPIPRVAQCGGAVPCQCGDTVIAHYTFTADLTCPVQGVAAALVLASGVTLTGNGHALVGTGGGIGVLFDQTQGSRVQALRVTGFAEGVKLRAGASANTLATVHAWGNHASLVFEQGNRNTVTMSRVYGDAGLALAMTDSHGNTFQATCIDGPVALQNSADNLFRGVAPKCPPLKSHVASR